MVLVSRYLGDTRSCKKIKLFYQQDIGYIQRITRDFSFQDHFDAMALFEYLLVEAYRKATEDPLEYRRLHEMHHFHQGQTSPSFRDKEREKLGISTSIDFCNYGKSRLRAIFQK